MPTFSNAVTALPLASCTWLKLSGSRGFFLETCPSRSAASGRSGTNAVGPGYRAMRHSCAVVQQLSADAPVAPKDCHSKQDQIIIRVECRSQIDGRSYATQVHCNCGGAPSCLGSNTTLRCRVTAGRCKQDASKKKDVSMQCPPPVSLRVVA